MNYLILILKHKWFVLIAGLKTKAPLWRLIIHDWSKLTPFEYRGYQRQFFDKVKDPRQWEYTWLLHQNRNPHHWQYWISRHKDGPKAIRMPEWAVREMIADWMGASRAYEGKWPTYENCLWIKTNLPKIYPHLHPITIARVDKVLIEIELPTYLQL